MQTSKFGGEREIGKCGIGRVRHSQGTSGTFLTDAVKHNHEGTNSHMISQMIALQTSSGLVPDLSAGTAILYIGLFGMVTMLTMSARSALAVLSWALTGVFLVLGLLSITPMEVYYLTLVFSFLSIGATVGFNRT
jgi:hypothetical protein